MSSLSGAAISSALSTSAFGASAGRLQSVKETCSVPPYSSGMSSVSQGCNAVFCVCRSPISAFQPLISPSSRMTRFALCRQLLSRASLRNVSSGASGLGSSRPFFSGKYRCMMSSAALSLFWLTTSMSAGRPVLS